MASALEFHGLSAEIRGQRVITEWSDLVGARIAQRTRPDGINDRILWIEVASSAWMHELNLLRPQLLRGLLDRLGKPALFDDLRFKLTGRTRRPQVGNRMPGPRPALPPRPFAMPATGAAREQIVAEVASVDDLELRALIAKVRISNDR